MGGNKREKLRVILHRTNHPEAILGLRPSRASNGHQPSAVKAAMGALVKHQIVCNHSIGECKRLTERQTEPFASDGIHAARASPISATLFR